MTEIKIVGGGLAGSEAAWQAARAGCRVKLYEMRPHKKTPVHKTGYLAELVCSNSLRSASLENAVGLLKEEMRRMDSLVIAMADYHAVPAGNALAVDRDAFAAGITAAIENHPAFKDILWRSRKSGYGERAGYNSYRPTDGRRPCRRDRQAYRTKITFLL